VLRVTCSLNFPSKNNSFPVEDKRRLRFDVHSAGKLRVGRKYSYLIDAVSLPSTHSGALESPIINSLASSSAALGKDQRIQFFILVSLSISCRHFVLGPAVWQRVEKGRLLFHTKSRSTRCSHGFQAFDLTKAADVDIVRRAQSSE